MTPEDEHTIQTLRTELAAQTRGHRIDPATATAVLDRVDAERQAAGRRPREYVALVAACLVVLGAAIGLYTARQSHSSTSAAATAAASNAPATTAAAALSACRGAVVTSALPEWARAGFSPDAYVNPHVTGATGAIIGVLFTNPLHSPARPGVNNKILWVARDPGTGPLVIRAQLEGSDRVATRTVDGGPGPSTIDLPAAGCWRVTLTWGGHADTVALPYSP